MCRIQIAKNTINIQTIFLVKNIYIFGKERHPEKDQSIMKTTLRILLFVILVFNSHYNIAQNRTIDSLKLSLAKANQDTTRCIILSALVESESNDSIWPIYNERLKQISEKYIANSSPDLKKYYSEYYASSLNNFGFLYNQQGNYIKAYEYFNKALNIQKANNDKKGLAASLANFGYLLRQQGDIAKALEYYHNALKIQLEIADKSGMATSYNNIAFVFENQGEYSKALEYYNKALKIYLAINDKDGIAICYGNIGYNYEAYGDPSCDNSKSDCKFKSLVLAITYLNKAIKIQEEIGDKNGLANSINIIAGIYENYGDPSCQLTKEKCVDYSREKAMGFYLNALKIREETKDLLGMTQSYNCIAEYMIKYGNLDKALQYAIKCMNTAKELGAAERIQDAAITLKKIYEKQNKFRESLEMYQLYTQMRDSINNEDTKKSAIKKVFQIEYEKQATKDSLTNVSKMIEEQLKHKNAIAQQRFYTYGGLVGFILMFVIAGLSFKAYKTKQKANIIISEQKRFVEIQKDIIEEKQKEIIDSINYAKGIQSAILANEKDIKEYFPNSFLLYQPKDIVAGDFYFFEIYKQHVFYAAADSTGHGVPGALVSIVCSNALSRSIKEFQLTKPGQILDKARELVLDTFKKSGQNVKDGMDISLLVKDFKHGTYEWAGANNPFWYIQNNEFKEIIADKQPIGASEDQKPFTTHILDLNVNDSLFLFTDGYADQFGGPKGKKFKYKQFKDLLLQNNHLPIIEQSNILSKIFNEWKGNLEQVDDVCVIGIKI